LTPIKTLMNPVGAVSESKERQRILVVDNDLDMLRFLNRTLDQEGFDTVIVADSDSALGVLDHLEPDMVIMDTATTDKVSMRALDRMREHSNVPIVVLTSDNRMATLKDAFAHGADDFIRKPFGTKIFIARIKAKLRRYQRAIRP
jgi:two-component system, OmpR family, KDP operon response regulator KdpE